MLAEERVATAPLAQQNEQRNAVTPEIIRARRRAPGQLLERGGVELAVFPCAEVTASPELETLWAEGRLLSVADRGAYLLVEMPHGLFVDLRPTARALRRRGVRIILAHPERHPELLHETEAIETLIREGCLVQVSSESITDPATAADRRALKSWINRGCIPPDSLRRPLAPKEAPAARGRLPADRGLGRRRHRRPRVQHQRGGDPERPAAANRRAKARAPLAASFLVTSRADG